MIKAYSLNNARLIKRYGTCREVFLVSVTNTICQEVLFLFWVLADEIISSAKTND